MSLSVVNHGDSVKSDCLPIIVGRVVMIYEDGIHFAIEAHDGQMVLCNKEYWSHC